jgi:N-acetylmuramoyl-L-alanine amidase
MALNLISRPSPNFDARTRPIDLVVLHYTGMQDGETALARLTDPAPVSGRYPGPWQDTSRAADASQDAPLSRVSVHYVVEEDGRVFQLVDEKDRAWHAGAGSWQGDGDVNSRAIGIEIVNGGHDFGLPDFKGAQIDAVIALLKEILPRWDLKPARVVGHSDVAPERKADPGEKFPWVKLAEAGVSIWPKTLAEAPLREDPVPILQERLAAFGYNVQANGMVDHETKAALIAFQRRFRPHLVNGAADAETCALLAGLESFIPRKN